MPANLTVTLDKSQYAPGETARASVHYVIPDDSYIELSGVARWLGEEFESPSSYVVAAELSADPSWQKESDDGRTAVFTAAVQASGRFSARLRVLGETVTAGADYTVASPVTLLVGSSNADTITELSAYESKFGPLKIRRSYDQPVDDLPASWLATAAAMDIGRRASVWSFKPNIPSFSTGGYDNKVRTFLSTIPDDGFEKWLIPWHEPEGEIKTGVFSASQFRGAAARFNTLVKETGRTDLTAAVCFAGTQCFDGQTFRTHGWDADDLAPEGMAACFDAYNKWPQPGFAWKEASDRFGLQAAWANAGKRPWGVSETGCYEHPDGPHVKVQWTRDAVSWTRDQGGRFFCYWDNAFPSDADKSARRLHSSPEHIAAWKELTS